MQRVTSPRNHYVEWRTRRITPALRDSRNDRPPEKLLQTIWQQQRLRREALHTSDGEPVRILHPGFRNFEAGPDFRGAFIQFGEEQPLSGDVEIDLVTGGWRAHGHDRNPNFKNVILHVVWENSAKTTVTRVGLRTLPLSEALDSPLPELERWLGGDSPSVWLESMRGRCCAPLRELSPEQINELLQQAALVRLQSKAAEIQARARLSGWEQALWEGLFGALGYKQNIWPMRRLAELRPELFGGKDMSPLLVQARLLGASGLLPTDLNGDRTSRNDYLRSVWNLWWRERDRFSDMILPRAIWKFSGLRPANHPQRRLALAAHWLAAGEELPIKLEHWMLRSSSEGFPARTDSLLEILQVKGDEFWSRHWTLKSAPMSRPQPLLGVNRVTDLAINVILPWMWLRANEGGNQSLQSMIERCYLSWPLAEDNSRLRLARQRLLGGAGRAVLKSAAAQQGLLQIMRDFCEHSNAICEQCSFPDLVRAWPIAQRIA